MVPINWKLLICNLGETPTCKFNQFGKKITWWRNYLWKCINQWFYKKILYRVQFQIRSTIWNLLTKKNGKQVSSDAFSIFFLFLRFVELASCYRYPLLRKIFAVFEHGFFSTIGFPLIWTLTKRFNPSSLDVLASFFVSVFYWAATFRIVTFEGEKSYC